MNLIERKQLRSKVESKANSITHPEMTVELRPVCCDEVAVMAVVYVGPGSRANQVMTFFAGVHGMSSTLYLLFLKI